MFRIIGTFALKLLPLLLHEVADVIKARHERKRQEKELTSKIKENENNL